MVQIFNFFSSIFNLLDSSEGGFLAKNASDPKKEYFLKRADFWLDEFVHLREITNSYSEKFGRLQIEISSILIGFSSVIIPQLSSPQDKGFINWVFLSSWLCLILSLFFGLINLKIKRAFWEVLTDKSQQINSLWFDYRKGVIAGPEVERVIAALFNSKLTSPGIYWKLQSSFLFLGVLLILVFTAIKIT